MKTDSDISTATDTIVRQEFRNAICTLLQLLKAEGFISANHRSAIRVLPCLRGESIQPVA